MSILPVPLQNNVVAAFNVTSKVLTTIVSASNPCVSSGALPRAAVPDCAGNLWIPGKCIDGCCKHELRTCFVNLIADFANNAVLMWNITTSSMTMVLSGPPLNGPKGIAVDPGGTIAFIANSNAGTISAVSARRRRGGGGGPTISPVAGVRAVRYRDGLYLDICNWSDKRLWPCSRW